MPVQLTTQSIARLNGVHPDLVKVVYRAAETTHLDFQVSEGLRSIERQRKLFREGASRTMHSRHLTGHAVDLLCYFDFNDDDRAANGEVTWTLRFYRQVAHVMRLAAEELSVPVEWGGTWTRNPDDSLASYSDGPHFQLPFSQYPE